MTVTILDGGMGRELKRMGAPFRQPEWSALALMEAPDFVQRAHAAFIAAGAEVITANSYALVPFHIGEDRFRADGQRLADLAGRMARQAANSAATPVKVAGSLPPLFGSYRPDLFRPADAPALLKVLIDGLSPHVDLWLAETQGSIAEALAVRAALGADPRPLWLSFTLLDAPGAPPAARSGESVADCATAATRLGAAALLFNCSQPEVMAAAIDEARSTLASLDSTIRVGCYANAFPPQNDEVEANGTLSALRDDLSPGGYLDFAQDWVRHGAGIVGGCCGIGPEHIAAIAKALKPEMAQA